MCIICNARLLCEKKNFVRKNFAQLLNATHLLVYSQNNMCFFGWFIFKIICLVSFREVYSHCKHESVWLFFVFLFSRKLYSHCKHEYVLPPVTTKTNTSYSPQLCYESRCLMTRPYPAYVSLGHISRQLLRVQFRTYLIHPRGISQSCPIEIRECPKKKKISCPKILAQYQKVSRGPLIGSRWCSSVSMTDRQKWAYPLD